MDYVRKKVKFQLPFRIFQIVKIKVSLLDLSKEQFYGTQLRRMRASDTI